MVNTLITYKGIVEIKIRNIDVKRASTECDNPNKKLCLTCIKMAIEVKNSIKLKLIASL